MNGTERTLNRINAAIEETEELENLLKSPATGYAIVLANSIRSDIAAAANTFGYFLEDFHDITPITGIPYAAKAIFMYLNYADDDAAQLLYSLRVNRTRSEADTAACRSLISTLASAKRMIESLTPEDLTPKEEA